MRENLVNNTEEEKVAAAPLQNQIVQNHAHASQDHQTKQLETSNSNDFNTLQPLGETADEDRVFLRAPNVAETDISHSAIAEMRPSDPEPVFNTKKDVYVD